MLRMDSPISWVVVGREELILNDLKAKPLLLSVRHSEGGSRSVVGIMTSTILIVFRLIGRCGVCCVRA